MATRHVVRSWRAERVNRPREKAARSELMDAERADAKASRSGRTIFASLAALGSVVLASTCCLPMFPFVFAAGAAGSSVRLWSRVQSQGHLVEECPQAAHGLLPHLSAGTSRRTA